MTSPERDPAKFAEAARWPIVEVWGPDPVVWAATGVGFAGVIRRQDDLVAHAAFPLTLTDGGVSMMFGKTHEPPEKMSASLHDISEELGPAVMADATQTAALIRACLAHGTRYRGMFPREVSDFVSLLPPSDAPSLIELAGRGVHPRALVEIARAHARLPDVEDGTEVMLLTVAEFRVEDPSAAIAALTAAAPEFDRHTRGEVATFDYTRPSKPGQRAPLSRIEGRRVQGVVTVEGDRLKALSGAPTMTARMLRTLLDTVPCGMELIAVRWQSPTLGQEWAWSAAIEPLAGLRGPRERVRFGAGS